MKISLYNLFKIVISIEVLVYFLLFLEAYFGVTIYGNFFYSSITHNSLMAIHVLMFLVMGIYGWGSLFFLKRKTYYLTFTCILGSIVYLAIIYKEVVIDKAF